MNRTEIRMITKTVVIFCVAALSFVAYIGMFRLDMQNNESVPDSILSILMQGLFLSVVPTLLVLNLNDQGFPLDKKPELQEGEKYLIVCVSVELQAFRYPPERVLYAAQRIADETNKNNGEGEIIFFYSKAIVPIKKPGGETFQIVDGLLVPSSV